MWVCREYSEGEGQRMKLQRDGNISHPQPHDEILERHLSRDALLTYGFIKVMEEYMGKKAVTVGTKNQYH